MSLDINDWIGVRLILTYTVNKQVRKFKGKITRIYSVIINGKIYNDAAIVKRCQ